MSSAPAISGPWRRRGRAALLFALLDLAAFNAYQVIKSPNPYPDFACFYAVAKAGATLGYSRMYDPAVQQQWVQQMFPGSPCVVVNPPPFAWLLAPLTALPYGLALWIWTVALIAAVVVASQVVAPRDLYLRVVYLASWLAFLPAYLIFISAPLGPLVVLSLALTWKFIRDDRPVLAGAILAVGLLKPTLSILVPLALLAAGHRRTFIAWLVVAIAAVGTSLIVLGPAGITAYVSLSASLAADPYYLRWSLVPLLGSGAPWLAAAAAITIATALIAWATRWRGVEVTIAVGVMGSVLINHHMTPGDLQLLLIPIWLLARARGSMVRDAGLAAAWVGGWLSLIFPVLAVVVAAAVPLGVALEGALKNPSGDRPAETVWSG